MNVRSKLLKSDGTSQPVGTVVLFAPIRATILNVLRDGEGRIILEANVTFEVRNFGGTLEMRSILVPADYYVYIAGRLVYRVRIPEEENERGYWFLSETVIESF